MLKSATALGRPKREYQGRTRRAATHLVCLGAGALWTLWAPPAAQAMAPDWGFGTGLQYRSAQEVRGFVMGEVDVLAYAGLRAEAALGAAQGALKAVLWAGPTISLDFATWVPVVFAGLGYRIGPSALVGTARAELRRYVSLHGAATFGAGAEWTMHEAVQCSAALSYYYKF